MKIFDRIFKNSKSKNTDKPSVPTKPNYFFTNSQDYNLGKIQLSCSGKLRIDAILAIAELEKIANNRNVRFEHEVMFVSLLEKGALTVPLVVEIGDEKYSIFFIYNKEDLSKYKNLIYDIKHTSYSKLIYFSVLDVNQNIEAIDIVEPFQLADLRVIRDIQLSGEYAMWWNTSDDSDFVNSESCKLLSDIYAVMKEYEKCFTGYILRQISAIDEVQLQRIQLPQENSQLILVAPEGKKVVLDMSQEKGIRFMFPKLNTSSIYRERFLRGVLGDLLATRITFEQANIEKDIPNELNGYDWFNHLVKSFDRIEHSLLKEGDVTIGITKFD